MAIQWKVENVWDGSLVGSFKRAASWVKEPGGKPAALHASERRAHWAIRTLRVEAEALRPPPRRLFRRWLPEALSRPLRYALRSLGLVNGNGYLDIAPVHPDDDTAGQGRLADRPEPERKVLPVKVGEERLLAQVDAEELAAILAEELRRLPAPGGDGTAARGDGGGGEKGLAPEDVELEAQAPGEAAEERAEEAAVLAARLLRACGESAAEAAHAAEVAAAAHQPPQGDGGSEGVRSRRSFQRGSGRDLPLGAVAAAQVLAALARIERKTDAASRSAAEARGLTRAFPCVGCRFHLQRPMVPDTAIPTPPPHRVRPDPSAVGGSGVRLGTLREGQGLGSCCSAGAVGAGS